MGGGKWSDDEYALRSRTRAATGTSAFAYTDDVSKGRAAAVVNDALNIKGKTRESRDSAEHPESTAIAVMFDVTGSMGQVPKELQKKLATLMNLIIVKGYVKDPQICFGAIGDANSDRAPLQVGQFESGNTMEDDLSRIYIEGNGGGQQRETYELAHYFFARHTVIDCFEKRGRKGYLFTIGDEDHYPRVMREQVAALIGDTIEAHLPVEDVVRECEARYHVFHIIAQGGGYPHNATIEASWKQLLGERVLSLEDAGNAAELIALTIGLCEGTIDIDAGKDHLKAAGVAAAIADSVADALVPFAKTTDVVKVGTITGDLPAPASDESQGIMTTR